MDKSDQFIRKCTLVVFGSSLNGLDLSALRIKFSVKRSETMTPNSADIRVYNLSKETALQIKKEFTRVILQAGYQGNFGVIFQGNIKQIIIGRESATDTFVDIVAGDGDRAYNFSIVNKTIDRGAKAIDQVNAAIKSMNSKGVTAGHIGDFSPAQLPRGKVMYGNSRNYLRNIAQTEQSYWSIQDEQVTFVSREGFLPGEIVVLTSITGMIGTPEQTNQGVNIKCLLNPSIQVSKRVKIDNASVQREKLNLDLVASAKGDAKEIFKILPRDLDADGLYYVLVMEHSGDTRGIEWYSSLNCLIMDQTTNPLNSVQGGTG